MATIGNLIAKLGVDNTQFVKGMKQAVGSVNQLEATTGATAKSSMGWVTKLKSHWLLALAAVTTAIHTFRKAIDLIKESTLLAAREEVLDVVLERMGQTAGHTSKELYEVVESLEKLGITSTQARQNTIRAMQAQIDFTDATKLARIAQDAAVIANMDSSAAYEQLIYGLQTGQIRVLRTMGLNVSFEQSYQKLADSMNKTTDELNDNERMQAKLNAVYEQAVAIQGSYEAAMTKAGKQLLSMRRYIENLKTEFGKAFLAGFSKAVMGTTEALKDLTDMVKGTALRSMISNIAESFGELYVGLTRIVSISARVVGAFDNIITRLFGLSKAEEDAEEKGETFIQSVLDRMGYVNQFLKAIETLYKITDRDVLFLIDEGQLTMLEAATMSTEELAKAMEDYEKNIRKITIEKEISKVVTELDKLKARTDSGFWRWVFGVPIEEDEKRIGELQKKLSVLREQLKEAKPVKTMAESAEEVANTFNAVADGLENVAVQTQTLADIKFGDEAKGILLGGFFKEASLQTDRFSSSLDDLEDSLKGVGEEAEVAGKEISNIIKDLDSFELKIPTLSDIKFSTDLQKSVQEAFFPEAGFKDVEASFERTTEAMSEDIEVNVGMKYEETLENCDIANKIFLERVQNATADVYYDIFRGQLNTFEDFADRMLDYFIRTLAEMAAASSQMNIFQGLLGGLTGGITGGWASGGLLGAIGGGLKGLWTDIISFGGNLWSTGKNMLNGLGDLLGLSGKILDGFTGLGMGFGVGKIGQALGIFKEDSFADLGASIGGAIGSAILPGIGSFLGSLGGGLLGSLFGGGGKPNTTIGPFTENRTEKWGSDLLSGTVQWHKDRWAEDSWQVQGAEALHDIVNAAAEEVYQLADQTIAALPDEFGDMLKDKLAGSNIEFSTKGMKLDLQGDLDAQATQWAEMVQKDMIAVFNSAYEQVRRVFVTTNVNEMVRSTGIKGRSLGYVDASNLIAAAGGFDELAASVDNFVNVFLTDTQRFSLQSTEIHHAFNDLGLALPRTREEFVKLIKTLDLTSNAGRQTYTSLLGMISSLDSYYGYIEQQEAARKAEAEARAREAQLRAEQARRAAELAQAEAARAAEAARINFKNIQSTYEDITKYTRNLGRVQNEEEAAFSSMTDTFDNAIERLKELGAASSLIATVDLQRTTAANKLTALYAQKRRNVFTDVVYYMKSLLGDSTALESAIEGVENQFDSFIETMKELGGSTQELNNIRAREPEAIRRVIEAYSDTLSEGFLDTMADIGKGFQDFKDRLSTSDLAPVQTTQNIRGIFERMLSTTQNAEGLDKLYSYFENSYLPFMKQFAADEAQYKDIYQAGLDAIKQVQVEVGSIDDNQDLAERIVAEMRRDGIPVQMVDGEYRVIVQLDSKVIADAIASQKETNPNL